MMVRRYNNSIEEFELKYRKIISSNSELYYPLAKGIENLKKNETSLIDCFDITDDYNNWIITLYLKEYCLIYSNGFSDNMILKLSKLLKFEITPEFRVFGSRNVVQALFSLNKCCYDLIKHRIIYSCDTIQAFDYAPGKMELGDYKRIDDLTRLFVEFIEAYDNKKEDFNKRRDIIQQQINNRTFYQWNNNNCICSIAIIMNKNTISGFYTDLRFRNKGFGGSLIHSLTRKMLNGGIPKCWLKADGKNAISNKVFVKTGYEKTGEFFHVVKK